MTAGTAAHVAAEASSNVVHFTSIFCKASDQSQLSHKPMCYIYAGSKNIYRRAVQSNATNFLCPIPRIGKTQEFRCNCRKPSSHAVYTRLHLRGETDSSTWHSFIKMNPLQYVAVLEQTVHRRCIWKLFNVICPKFVSQTPEAARSIANRKVSTFRHNQMSSRNRNHSTCPSVRHSQYYGQP